MKKLAFALVLVPLLASAAVCRYCSGTKYRTVENVCDKCGGSGIFFTKSYQRITCPHCDKARGLARSCNRGEVVPSSGRIRRRVPCDKCAAPKVREIVITPAQLDALRNGERVSVGDICLIVRAVGAN